MVCDAFDLVKSVLFCFMAVQKNSGELFNAWKYTGGSLELGGHRF